MKETIDKIIAFIKANFIISIIAGIMLILIFFGKQVSKIFAPPRRRRRRKAVTVTRTRTRRRTNRRPLPRSAGRKRPATKSGKGYPAAGGGYIPFKYNKDGTSKKAWQVGGTLAAKQRMARLRRAR